MFPAIDGLDFEELLGEGLGGRVFAATHRASGRAVAVKVLHASHAGSDPLAVRFRREAELLVRNPHPALVPILAASLDHDPPFLILARMAGDLAEAGPRPAPDLLRAGSRVASALAHLHRRGIVHRDVKPANLMRDASGEVYLGDLGLAQVTDGLDLTRTGAVVGTPGYLAPEVLGQGRASAASDLYALGVTLAVLATGRRPELRPGRPPFEEEVLASLEPPGFRALLRRLLREVPEDRGESADRVAADLAEILADGPGGDADSVHPEDPTVLPGLAPPAEAPAWAEGLPARYEPLRLLGQGGMGQVALVHDRELDRLVGLKRIKGNLASSPRLARRFRREARALAALRHPNVVEVFSAEIDAGSGQLLLAMEYLEGESLESVLDRRGTLPLGEALEVAADLAAGIDAVHAAGLVHRDLKPANVMRDAVAGRWCILDLGLARNEEDSTLTGTGFIAGTPKYLAPEVLKGRVHEAPGDLFQVAHIVYEALAGRPLVESARDTPALLERLMVGDFDPFPAPSPEVPGAVWEVLHRSLDPDPDRRPGSGAELLAELRTAAGLGDGATAEFDPERSLATPALSASLPGAEASVGSRRPLLAALLVAGLGAGLGVSLVARPRPDAPDLPDAPRPVTDPAGASLERLAHLTREMLRDEAVRDAIGMVGTDQTPEALETWRRGRRAFLALAEARGLGEIAEDLGRHPLGPRHLDSLSALAEIEGLLSVGRVEGVEDAPLGPGGAALRRTLARWARAVPPREFPWRVESDDPYERGRNIARALPGDGRVWHQAWGYPEEPGVPAGDDNVVFMNFDGMEFQHPGVTDQQTSVFRELVGHSNEGDPPRRLEVPLRPLAPGRPLDLLVILRGRVRHVMVAELRGSGEASVRATFLLPETPRVAEAPRGHYQPVYLGVEARALPPGLDRLLLHHRGLQPIVGPKYTHAVAEVHQLLEGPRPEELAAARPSG